MQYFSNSIRVAALSRGPISGRYRGIEKPYLSRRTFVGVLGHLSLLAMLICRSQGDRGRFERNEETSQSRKRCCNPESPKLSIECTFQEAEIGAP